MKRSFFNLNLAKMAAPALIFLTQVGFGQTITGSGTTMYLPMFNGTSTIANSPIYNCVFPVPSIVIGGATAPISGEYLSVQKNANIANFARMYNNTIGNAASAGYAATAGGSGISMFAYNTSFTTSGIYEAGAAVLNGSGTTMNIGTTANIPLTFWTNTTKRMTLSNTGDLSISTLGGGTGGAGTFRRLYVDNAGKLVSSNNTVSGTNSISWDLGGNVSAGATLGAIDGSDLPIWAGTGEKVRIMANGGIKLNEVGATAQGVIQCGGSPITSATDMGLYSLRASYYMRFVTNGGAFNFFSDGGTNPVGGSTIFSIAPTGFTSIIPNQNAQALTVTTNHTGDYGYNTNINVNRDLTKALVVRNTASSTGGCGQEKFLVYGSGQTFIGGNLTSGAYMGALLQVNGQIAAKEVHVLAPSFWCDFVFDKGYKLRSLGDLESYYKENKHLPDVPSEAEVMENGVDMAGMDAVLLRKVEESTLYIVQQQKEIENMKAEMEKMKKENGEIKTALKKFMKK